MEKILTILKSKWLRNTSLTIVLIGIIIAGFILFNLWIQKLELTDIDITKEKVYTISETSKEQLSKIPESDKIEIYLFDYVDNSAVADFAKQYSKINENISVEITSVSDRKDLASQYEIETGNYSILLISGNKNKILSGYDLYTTDYSSGDMIDLTEQKFTNAIIDVSSIGKTKPLYFLTGHDEYKIDTEMTLLTEYLKLENYELKEIDLLIQEQIPEDCTALVICSPKKDFKELEVEKIKEYINKGGNILWMNDAFSKTEELTNIQSILDMYGVTIHQEGIMYEQDILKMALQNPYLMLPEIEASELAGELANKGAVMLVQTSKLTFEDNQKMSELNVTKTNLLSTSESAFFRTDLSKANEQKPTESDEIGKQVVGAVLTKNIDDNTNSKLVVYGNNYFLTDAPVVIGQQAMPAITLYNNRDMLLNSVAYVSEMQDGITIRKSIEKTYYTPTEMQDRVIRSIIYGVPLVIVIVGIIMWQRRRRKK